MEAKITLQITINEGNVEQKIGETLFSDMDENLAVALMKVVQGTRRRLETTIERFTASRKTDGGQPPLPSFEESQGEKK